MIISFCYTAHECSTNRANEDISTYLHDVGKELEHESYTYTHSEKLTLHLGAPDGTILGLLSILGSVVIVTHLLRKVLVLVEIAG